MRRRNRINVVATIAKLSLLPVWPDETSLDLDSGLMTMSSAELRPLCTKRQTRMSGQMKHPCGLVPSLSSATSARFGSVRFGSARFGSTRSTRLLSSRLPQPPPPPHTHFPRSTGHCLLSSILARCVNGTPAVARAALHEWKLSRVYQTHAMCHCNGCQFALSFDCRHIYIHRHACTCIHAHTVHT